ncbi:MAG: BON domain-containing protein, partial [Terriglobales bacterium]
TVCLNASNTGELLLTGTVASPSEVSAVEQAAQPLVAGGRLADQLTIGSLPSTSQVATGGTAGLATESTSAADASTPSSTAIASGPVPSTPAPSGITAEENNVEQALHSIPRLANVDVEVRADAVRLSGTVDTVQDEQMATAIARQHVPGMSVIDNLTVAVRTPQS